MNDNELLNWLLTNGGPAIRYRTAAELMATHNELDISQLREELARSPLVKSWFEKAVPSLLFNDIHGSKSAMFENVMGKLTDLGIRKGNDELDRYTLPYREWLSENSERPPGHIFSIFMRTLIAAFLARAGYTNAAVAGLIKDRLATIYEFTRQGDYDVYVNPADYPRMPPSFQKKPLINPKLSKAGNLKMPWRYDIIGLAAYLPEYGTEDDRAKADTIIKYILDDRYQRLYPGYGILKAENGKYYAMGWSIWLPGFFNYPSNDARPGRTESQMVRTFIQRLILMGQFPATRKHSWFTDSMNYLNNFRTENGTYLFPKPYLLEKSVGYWVTGSRMGVEENRRKIQALELESTFRMMKLKSLR